MGGPRHGKRRKRQDQCDFRSPIGRIGTQQTHPPRRWTDPRALHSRQIRTPKILRSGGICGCRQRIGDGSGGIGSRRFFAWWDPPRGTLRRCPETGGQPAGHDATHGGGGSPSRGGSRSDGASPDIGTGRIRLVGLWICRNSDRTFRPWRLVFADGLRSGPTLGTQKHSSTSQNRSCTVVPGSRVHEPTTCSGGGGQTRKVQRRHHGVVWGGGQTKAGLWNAGHG
mmetsp:Transcript_7081/g.20577  ORF Transcript_7081/g.20577 Transcript_7081/m.20577 type:complete len:225 (+) Transcript_7081:291-965(+)